MRRFGALLAYSLLIGFLAAGCLAAPGAGINPPAPTQAEPPSWPPLPCALDLPQMFNKARPAIVMLIAMDASGQETGLGSGFFISPDGKLVTNAHVIAEAAEVMAKSGDGRTWKVAGVLAADMHSDLALIQVEAGDVPYLTLGGSREIRVGRQVAIIGNPLGLEGVISAGRLTGKPDRPWPGEWLQLSAQATGGYSGSPVFDECGRVIGVNTFVAGDNNEKTIAAPVEALSRLMDKAGWGLKPLPFSEGADKFKIREEPVFKAAWEAWSKGDPEKAAEGFRSLARKFPKDSEIRIYLGQVLLMAEAPDEAVAAFDEAVQLEPDFVSAYWNRGNAYFQSGRFQEAMKDFDQALRIKPDFFSAYTSRGYAHSAMSQFEKAMEDSEQAIRINPDYVPAYILRGTVHGGLDQTLQAIADFDQAIRLDPVNSDAHTRRGMAYFQSGRIQRAFEDFDKAVLLNPKDALAFKSRGDVHLKLRQTVRAISDYDRAIAIVPKYSDALTYRGLAHGDSGRHKEAVADYDQALRLNPGDAVAYFGRGLSYDHLGQFLMAIADYTQALRLAPNSGEIHGQRGGVYLKLNQYRQACADFQAACGLGLCRGLDELKKTGLCP